MKAMNASLALPVAATGRQTGDRVPIRRKPGTAAVQGPPTGGGRESGHA